MWLWTAAPNDQVIRWAAARGVAEIFAWTATGGTAMVDHGRLSDLKRRADAAGIRLSALGGDPSWVADPADALSWQRAVRDSGLFAGYHVDVEPYLRPEWALDRDAGVRAYLRLLDLLRPADGLPLEADVPFWYGEISVDGRNVADEILRRVDAVTVLTYRNTATGPNSVLDVGADMLARATTAGRAARLAAETQPMPGCAHCTFRDEGEAVMTTVLAAVDGAARAYPAYAGIGIHHYDSWAAMPP
jgi:hypothetical protein